MDSQSTPILIYFLFARRFTLACVTCVAHCFQRQQLRRFVCPSNSANKHRRRPWLACMARSARTQHGAVSRPPPRLIFSIFRTSKRSVGGGRLTAYLRMSSRAADQVVHCCGCCCCRGLWRQRWRSAVYLSSSFDAPSRQIFRRRSRIWCLTNFSRSSTLLWAGLTGTTSSAHETSKRRSACVRSPAIAITERRANWAENRFLSRRLFATLLITPITTQDLRAADAVCRDTCNDNSVVILYLW